MFELIPWKRTNELTTASRDVEQMFRRFFEGFPLLEREWEGTPLWAPSLDVKETDKEVVVEAELPGMETKDIDISLTDDVLTIKGEKREKHEEKNECCHRVERRYGSFSRAVRLPVAVEDDKINASYKQGVLKIILPKTKEAKEKVRKIAIS